MTWNFFNRSYLSSTSFRTSGLANGFHSSGPKYLSVENNYYGDGSIWDSECYTYEPSRAEKRLMNSYSFLNYSAGFSNILGNLFGTVSSMFGRGPVMMDPQIQDQLEQYTKDDISNLKEHFGDGYSFVEVRHSNQIKVYDDDHNEIYQGTYRDIIAHAKDIKGQSQIQTSQRTQTTSNNPVKINGKDATKKNINGQEVYVTTEGLAYTCQNGKYECATPKDGTQIEIKNGNDTITYQFNKGKLYVYDSTEKKFGEDCQFDSSLPGFKVGDVEYRLGINDDGQWEFAKLDPDSNEQE